MVVAPSPTIVASLVLLFGAGFGPILPSVDAASTHVVSGEFRAGAQGLRNSATGLGRAADPLFVTGLAAVTGYRRQLLSAGIAMFSTPSVEVAAYRLCRREHRVPARPERRGVPQVEVGDLADVHPRV